MTDANPQPATSAAIIVVAYNRPESLSRLLTSIAKASYAQVKNIPIVISIDGGGSHHLAVKDVADRFDWPHGPKEIVAHETNLGLIEHVFSCGDLSQRFGRIILLEDDLVVGGSFYAYAQRSLDFFAGDPQVAGISLSALWFHGFTQLPFTPYPDDGDNFFMQVAWYQGQAYTAEQWQRFRDWLQQDGGAVTPEDRMHPMFSDFPETDWFPSKTRYLVKTGRFYAFPRQSLAVNFGETGTHFSQPTSFFQVPVQDRRSGWRFQSLSESVAVYDSWQEMLPDRLKRLAPDLEGVTFVTDFYAQRDPELVSAELMLTTQPSDPNVARNSWGLTMRPPEANLAHGVTGDGIRLIRPDAIDYSLRSRFIADWERYRYFNNQRPIGRWQRVRYLLGRWFSRFR